MCEDAKQIKGVNWNQLVSWIIPIFVAILVIVVNNYIATSTGIEHRVRANEIDIETLKVELIEERSQSHDKTDKILQDVKEIKETVHNMDKRLIVIESRWQNEKSHIRKDD